MAEISVITTAHNEEENVIPFFRELRNAMGGMDYEVVFVDDGSTDKTYDRLKGIKDNRLKIVRVGSRKGKCAALWRGMEESRGGVIATIDSDLQNDPGDILRMLGILEGGKDFVCGWRVNRKDGPVKRGFSFFGNILMNTAFGTNLHDHACPVKVFRRGCFPDRYFEHLHRFMGVLAVMRGFRVAECRVRHRFRVYGKSKYGTINRMGTLKIMVILKLKGKNMVGVRE